MNRNQRRLANKQGGGQNRGGNPAVPGLYEEALRCHRAGRLPEAERLYRQILALDPQHADSLHLLGVMAYQVGRLDRAVELIGQAIRLRDGVPDYYNNLGNALRAQGKLDDGVAAYRRAIVLKPSHAEAHNNLGNALVDQGQLGAAVTSYERAIALKPGYAEAHNNLGNALWDQGKAVAALASLKRAIALKPDYAEAHNNLGNALRDQGRVEDAAAAYRRALVLNPDFAQAQSNLGNVLRDLGRLDEAVAAHERAVALQPDFPEAHNNFGNALRHQGKTDAAIARYERAIELKPDYAEAYNNLGAALQDQGRAGDAATSHGRAIALKPGFAEAHNNLGNALRFTGEVGSAVESFERAIALKPGYAEAHNNLGNALRDQGKLGDALTNYERAIALRPDFHVAHSGLLLGLNYEPTLPAERLEAASRRWRELHPTPRLPAEAMRGIDRDAERRLRVGYVSPDFRRHSVSYFLEPLLRAHNHGAVEIFCYAEVHSADAVTDRLKALGDHWLSTVGMTDDALAQRIREDGIDILVDLAGHTAGNRLAVFARKPAPLQLTWLGYPNTTGLTTIDYRLVDAVTDPEDETAQWQSEHLLRLDGGFLCYGPPEDAPEPAPPPGLDAGFVTFGSFNALAKLSPPTLDAWAALLRRMPTARLLLKERPLADPATRALFEHRFAERDIAPERITLLGSVPDTAGHLAVYRQVDIALDPFPYNGTTTTCEALWMGVPVVTLRGDRHAGRVGASLLGGVGLGDLIAGDAEDYVAIAAGLAADPMRLTDLHRSLRQRMAASPLCDAAAFARRIEIAYRGMWRRWCEQAPDA